MDTWLISLSEAAYKLGEYKTNSSVESWAEKRGIKVFKLGKGKYMIREEFIRAYDQPVIDYLIEKYGEKRGLELYNNRESHTDRQPRSTINRYKPKGSAEKKFLEKINSKV